MPIRQRNVDLASPWEDSVAHDWNAGKADIDFRWRGDTAEYLMYLDAGLDAFQVGAAAAGSLLDIRGTSLIINEGSADMDIRIESNALAAFFNIDGSGCLNGQLSIGAAVPTNPQAMVSLLPPANASGVTLNQSYFHAQILPGGATTVPAGTAPVVASLNIHEPNITATGTVTDAATVRIVDAPTEGTRNHALWVDAGLTRLDGNLVVGGVAPTNPQAFVALLPQASSITADQSYFHQQILPGGATTVPTGTAPVVASLNIHEPNITATGTVTVGATVRIVDAPTEGTTNFALWVDAGATRLDGTTYIGDDVNANVTLGLTINQGAADDQIFALKSSDVAHGATVLAEADTYGAFSKAEATSGGLLITGYKDGDGVSGHALMLRGVLDETAADTTKTTAGIGVITLTASLEGTNDAAVCGADENLVVIRNLTTTRFIFDVEGSAHADVEWVAFDKHDDLALLNALEADFADRRGDATKMAFGSFLDEHREVLQREKIVNFYDEGPRGMVNFTRLTMLLVGAVRQLGNQVTEQQAQLAALTAPKSLAAG